MFHSGRLACGLAGCDGCGDDPSGASCDYAAGRVTESAISLARGPYVPDPPVPMCARRCRDGWDCLLDDGHRGACRSH